MEWFIMVSVVSKLMLVGPFTEDECKVTKRLMFGDGAVCVERRMIDGKRAA